MPCIATLAIVILNEFSLWFLNGLMHANVDKGLLVKELLVDVTNQLLSCCLHAKGSDWLNQLGTNWKISGVLKLLQIELVLGLIFGI